MFHFYTIIFVVFVLNIQNVQNVLEQKAESQAKELEFLTKPFTEESNNKLYEIVSVKFPAMTCLERAEVRKKFRQLFGRDLALLLMEGTNPPIKEENSAEIFEISITGSWTVFHQLVAASTFCGPEYFGFQLFYFIKTRGGYEAYDFIDDITVSLTEKPGRESRDESFKVCNELLGVTSNCLESLYDIVNNKEKDHKYEIFTGDFGNIFKELLEEFVRSNDGNVDPTKANEDARRILDCRKGFEDERQTLDEIIFRNPFPYVAEVMKQFPSIDNNKEMTTMLEQKMEHKGPIIYTPMLNRMRDNFKFHAEQINHYLTYAPHKGHLVGSVILTFVAQNITDELKKFTVFFDEMYPNSGGLVQILNSSPVDIKYAGCFLTPVPNVDVK